jgi:ribosomal protein L10
MQVTDMRKKLPAGTHARVVKNSLMRVAATELPEWQVRRAHAHQLDFVLPFLTAVIVAV